MGGGAAADAAIAEPGQIDRSIDPSGCASNACAGPPKRDLPCAENLRPLPCREAAQFNKVDGANSYEPLR